MSFLSRRKVKVPLFSFSKKSVVFLFNGDFWKKSYVSLFFLFVLSVVSLGATTQQVLPDGNKTIVANPFVMFPFLISFFLVNIATMVRVQRLVFENTEERKNFFGFSFGRIELKYALRFFQMFAMSFLISLAVAVLGFFICMHFFDNKTAMFFFTALLLGAIPFFMVRFICFLVSGSEKEPVSLMQSWRMTQNQGMSLCCSYILTALVPIFAAVILSVPLQFLMAVPLLFAIVSSFLSLLMFWLSGVTQSVYMSLFYLHMKEEKLSDGFSESFIFSIAKKKEQD